MSFTNSKSLPRGERLHADLAVAELAVAAGLLLVAAVPFRRGLDRLAVGDPRLLEVDLDPEAAFSLATVTSMCDCPMPARSISWVCASRV